MKETTIKLFSPYQKQRDVIDALNDDNFFFVIVCAGRQVGKSLLGMNVAIKWANDNPNRIVYWVSPTDSQAHKVYKQIINACYHTGCIKSNKGGKGDTEIIFTSKSKILFRSAASEDSLRGESVDYMILDEGSFIKRDTLNSILLPMLSSRGKKLLAISTPKGKNWFYDWYLKGFQEPRYKSFRFSTYDSPYANKELIEMFKNSLPDKLYKQEIEAEFIDSSSIFSNLDEVMSLNSIDSPQPNCKYWAGIDIALVNDSSVLSIIDQNGDLVKYFRWTGVESPELIQNILEVNKIWNFQKILIENNNQGLGIYQELKRNINNIIDFNTNTKSKPEMINALIHAFNMKSFKIVKDEYLRIELEAFIFKQNDNGHIKFMADNGFHDDCVISLAIARWCFKNYNKPLSAYLKFY